MIKRRVTSVMEKQDKKNTANDLFAVNEVITPLQLLQEIEPLLDEYFIGDFKIENNALNMKFKNGQTFKLKVCEVV